MTDAERRAVLVYFLTYADVPHPAAAATFILAVLGFGPDESVAAVRPLRIAEPAAWPS